MLSKQIDADYIISFFEKKGTYDGLATSTWLGEISPESAVDEFMEEVRKYFPNAGGCVIHRIKLCAKTDFVRSPEF